MGSIGLMRIRPPAPPPAPIPFTGVVKEDTGYSLYINGSRVYTAPTLKHLIEKIKEYDVNVTIPDRNIRIVNRKLASNRNLDQISFYYKKHESIDFRKIGKVIHYDNFSSNPLDANLYTRVNNIGNPTVSWTPGRLTISTTSTTPQEVFFIHGKPLPVFIYEIDVVSASINNLGTVILVLYIDANNYIVVDYLRSPTGNTFQFEIYVKKGGSGSVKWSSSADITPPFTLISLFVCGVIHVLYEKDGRVIYVGKYNANSDFDFRNPATYDQFRIGFGVHVVNSSITIDRYAVYLSAFGIRDQYLVTLTDGVTPVYYRGKYLITATGASNEFRDSYMLLMSYDPHTDEYKVESVILNIINNRYYTDHAGTMIYDPDRDTFIVFNSSWSSSGYGVYDRVYIHYFETKILDTVISGSATRMQTPTEAYDPAVFYDPSTGYWYLLCEYGYIGERSIALLRNTSLAPTGWSIVARTPTQTQTIEGSHVSRVGGQLYALWTNEARFPTAMRYSVIPFTGSFEDKPLNYDPKISRSGINPPHPCIIPVHSTGSTKYKILTFTQSIPVTGTVGTNYVYESNESNDGYEVPIVIIM